MLDIVRLATGRIVNVCIVRPAMALCSVRSWKARVTPLEEFLRHGKVNREGWMSLPFVEGHVWRVVAEAHHIAPAGVAQHVVHLLGAVGEQERSVRFVSLEPKATVSAP